MLTEAALHTAPGAFLTSAGHAGLSESHYNQERNYN